MVLVVLFMDFLTQRMGVLEAQDDVDMGVYWPLFSPDISGFSSHTPVVDMIKGLWLVSCTLLCGLGDGSCSCSPC